MRRRRSRQFRSTDPFIDLLFNALLGFTFLFLVAVMFINPEARKGRVDLKAEYIISVTWPELLADEGYFTACFTDCYHYFKPGMNMHRGFRVWEWVRGQEYDAYRSGSLQHLHHCLPVKGI